MNPKFLLTDSEPFYFIEIFLNQKDKFDNTIKNTIIRNFSHLTEDLKLISVDDIKKIKPLYEVDNAKYSLEDYFSVQLKILGTVAPMIKSISIAKCEKKSEEYEIIASTEDKRKVVIKFVIYRYIKPGKEDKNRDIVKTIEEPIRDLIKKKTFEIIKDSYIKEIKQQITKSYKDYDSDMYWTSSQFTFHTDLETLTKEEFEGLKKGDYFDNRYKIIEITNENISHNSKTFPIFKVEDKYEAYSNTYFALKILWVAKSDIELQELIELLNILNREHSLFGKIQNYKNVIKLYNNGLFLLNVGDIQKEIHYLVFEWIEGGKTLIDVDIKAIDNKDKAIIITSLLDGLEELATQKIIHRDLKPENIMIPFVNGQFVFEELKIIDFGTSKILSRKAVVDGSFPASYHNNPYTHCDAFSDDKQNCKHDLFSATQIFWRIFTNDLSLENNIWNEGNDKNKGEKVDNHPDNSNYADDYIKNSLERIDSIFIREILRKGLKLKYSSPIAMKRDFEQYFRMCSKAYMHKVNENLYIDKNAVTYEDFEIFLEYNVEWQKQNCIDANGKVIESIKKQIDENYLLDWPNTFKKGANFPAYKKDYPVVFVSFLVAQKYAEFVGKELLDKDVRNNIIKKNENENENENDKMFLYDIGSDTKQLEPQLIYCEIVKNKFRDIGNRGPFLAKPKCAAKNYIYNLTSNIIEIIVSNSEEDWLTNSSDWYHNNVKPVRRCNNKESCHLLIGFRCQNRV